jgi:hypothetical protein
MGTRIDWIRSDEGEGTEPLALDRRAVVRPRCPAEAPALIPDAVAFVFIKSCLLWYNFASIGPRFYTALAKNQSFLGRHGDACCASGTGAYDGSEDAVRKKRSVFDKMREAAVAALSELFL